MARQPSKGVMSEEQKQKIAEKVRAANAQKRIDQGLPPLDEGGIPARNPDLKIETIKMRDQHFDPSLFVPMKTEKPIDLLFTNEGGLPKATNYIVIGDPGVGKSTVCMDILADLVSKEFKCLFVSAEMTRIDLYQYVQRYPKFGDLDILFLNEYDDDNPKYVVEDILDEGYDVVLLDSFAEVQSSVREINRMTSMGSEKWIIDLMIKHNAAENKTKKNTMFLCIQQVTKGGTFVGSNKLKHNTTGMMEIRFDDESGTSSYIFFSKNRRGPVNKKMYFNLRSTENVEYDKKRFSIDESARETLEGEKKRIEEEEENFDKILIEGRNDKGEDVSYAEGSDREEVTEEVAETTS